MKKGLLGLIGFFILLIITSGSASASHVMGSDIQFRCLGNGKWEVTLKVYRDCNGITLSNSPITVIPVGCSGSSFNLTLQQISIVDITPVCSTVQSKCSGGSYQYGIEEYTFKGTLDLSSSTYANCCKFNITWNQCCRNGAITTGPGGCDFTTVATLNKCVTPCNSSPQITNRPIAIICAGQDFCFNNGILDSIDGDSLSYEMDDPLASVGSPCPFGSGYSKDKPLMFLGSPNKNATLPAGFHLDPVTGDLCFRPTKVEIGVMVIKVTEWRKINGTLTNVGETRRDMQIIVTTCSTNKVPNVLGPYAYEACANSKICFDMQSTDLDAGDTVRVTWNKGIPGATFSAAFGSSGAGAKKQKGTFCWTPTDDDVSSNPYYFTVMAKDNACPINATTVKAYSVTVNPMPRGTRTITKQKCGIVSFAITPTANYGTLDYAWKVKKGNTTYASSTSSSFTHQFSESGRYIVQSTLKTLRNCSFDYFDTLDVDTFAVVNLPNDTFLCDGSSLTMTGIAKFGEQPYKYLWNTGLAKDTFPSLTIKPYTINEYKLTITDKSGCVYTDSMTVDVKPLPPVDLGPDKRICSYESYDLDAGPDLKYLWSYLNLTTQTVTVKDSSNYWVKVTDTLGCSNYDTMQLRVNVPVIINPIPDVNLCFEDSVTLTGNGGDVYTWTNLSNNISTTGKSIRISPTTTVMYQLKTERTYKGVTCEDYDTVKVTVNYNTPITFPTYFEVCEDVANVPLTATPADGFGGSGVWTCTNCPAGSVVNSTSDGFKPNVAKKGTWNIVYTFTNNFGCMSKDSFQITVNPLAVLNPGAARSACNNATPIKLVGTTNIPGGTTKWSCLNCPSPSAIFKNSADTFFFDPAQVPVGTYNLEYRYTTPEGCVSIATSTFKVMLVPPVDAGTLAAVCQNGDPINLSAKSGASPAGGVWSGPGVNTSTGEFDPASAGQGTHKLFYYLNISGCDKLDSVDIFVNAPPTVDAGVPQTICYPYAGTFFSLVGMGNGNPNPAGSRWYCSSCPAGSDPVTGFNFDPSYVGSGNQKIFDLTYEYTDPTTGCVNSDVMVMTVNRMATLFIPGQGDPLCEGQPFMVKAIYTGTNGIEWAALPGEGTFDDYQADSTLFTPGANVVSTTITASTDTVFGCPTIVADLIVNVFPTPTAIIQMDKDNGCIPLAIQFSGITNAGAGARFTWDFGDPDMGTSTAQDPAYVFTKDGTWNVSLVVTSADNCSSKPTIQPIVAHPLPVAGFSWNPEYITVSLPKVEFINKSTGATTYEWRFGDMDNTISTEVSPVFVYPADTFTYSVEHVAITEFGCRDSITRRVMINPDILVFIPTAFTPDDQGPARNNKFYIDVDGITDYNLIIFNRWGEILFRTKDRYEGWDGMYNQVPCQQDVYVYKLDVISFEGKPYTYNGTVTLLR